MPCCRASRVSAAFRRLIPVRVETVHQAIPPPTTRNAIAPITYCASRLTAEVSGRQNRTAIVDRDEGNALRRRPVAAGGAGSFELVEDDLAEADGGRRDLDALVLADELQGLFQREVPRRDQANQLLGGRLADVPQLLTPGGGGVPLSGAGLMP